MLFPLSLCSPSATRAICLLLGLAWLGLSHTQARTTDPSTPWNSGLLYDQFQLTLSAGTRTEILGPFHYEQESEAGRVVAFPPLFSVARNPELESVEFDVAYPVFTYDRYGEQYRIQLFQLLSFAGGVTQVETNRDRFTIFPIYFQQRSSDPEENYTAVVPFYGHLQNRLYRDEIFFLMFPAYSRTRKGEVITRNYVYPFFHLREGGGVEGWQAWPFAGHEIKEITQRTNRFGDLVSYPGHEKWMVLWPVFSDQKLGLGTENPEHHRALLPAFYLQRSPQRDQTTVLWPFFSKIDDRGRKYQEWHAPWPFIVMARGEGKTITRFWPIFSQAESTNLSTQTYMFPIYRRTRLQSAPLDRERTRILFFLYSAVRETNTETHHSRLRRDFWPFYTWRKDWNGSQRLQILAALEPVLPNNRSIERNYSHVYSLWRAETNTETGASSQSFLWNLYRHERDTDSRQTSLLFGLFQSYKGDDGRRLRIFYIPFGKKAERTATP